MTILIIVAILIAIAYIFGKRSAQIIVLGSGALGLGLIVLGLIGALIYYLWDQGVIAFIFSAVFVLLAIGWVAEFLKKDEESQKSKLDLFINEHPYFYLFIIFSVIFVGIGMFYLKSSENIEISDNNPTSYTFEELQALGATPVYKYTLKDVTNVRTCGSQSCGVIGQYPLGTEFEFSSPWSGLPEWIEISWVDQNGKTQYGYIHKSTLN